MHLAVMLNLKILNGDQVRIILIYCNQEEFTQTSEFFVIFHQEFRKTHFSFIIQHPVLFQ